MAKVFYSSLYCADFQKTSCEVRPNFGGKVVFGQILRAFGDFIPQWQTAAHLCGGESYLCLELADLKNTSLRGMFGGPSMSLLFQRSTKANSALN